jgi:TRAP-type C4-dicarboxylate transport system permease large subunit
VLPFLASNVAALLLTTFCPSLALSLPRLILR